MRLQEKGYRTAFFGKYLNNYNGTYVPPGWHKWFGLKGNSRYFNYKIANWEASGKREKSKVTNPPRSVANAEDFSIRYEDKPSDYLTNVLTKHAIKYFKKVKSEDPADPLLMVLNYPAPHGPEDAHPKYQKVFDKCQSDNVTMQSDKCLEFADTLTAHRRLVYNHIDKVNKSKHWFLRWMEPMDDRAMKFTDLLQRRRLQTLLSVDDGIQKVCIISSSSWHSFFNT